MPKLLLEIGCEELPGSACREAERQLPDLCVAELGGPPEALFVGPRRLALVKELPERIESLFVAGPPVAVAYDETGKPTKAAEGFARKAGVAVTELVTENGQVGVMSPPVPIADVVPEKAARIVRSLVFGKSMRWGPELRFSRPVRWICTKLDGETVGLDVEGVPSGGTSHGHRFAGSTLEIGSADSYAAELRKAGVEPDQRVRRRSIVEGLDAIGEWSDPRAVLEEVVYLVESPVVLEGRFDERFLQLPRRVIETAMQSHQRYFPLEGPRFAFVANGGAPDVVRQGNERVLEGRLDDATFTFERDLTLGIEGLSKRLAAIMFIAEGGSYDEKARRLVKLVDRLGGGDASREAARLAKADQAAELVREFPELEGYIGAEYARLAGYPEAVCKAIEEHYLPDTAGGPLPTTDAGKVLSAADKIDTLAVAFRLGHRPTGSRDPYALRRAAIGLCRLALEGGLAIPREELEGEVREFVEERLESLLELPVEFVRAARRSPISDLGRVAALARALAELDEPKLDALHTVYTRAERIARASEDGSEVDQGLLTEDAERDVARTLERIEPHIAAALEGDFERAFAAAAELEAPLARFFDEVLVMAEDKAVRRNRLALMQQVRQSLAHLGDFSQIPR